MLTRACTGQNIFLARQLCLASLQELRRTTAVSEVKLNLVLSLVLPRTAHGVSARSTGCRSSIAAERGIPERSQARTIAPGHSPMSAKALQVLCLLARSAHVGFQVCLQSPLGP